MANKYDSIDFCLNMLYDFVYNKQNTTQCYTTKRIQRNSVELLDLKKPDDFDYEEVLKGSDLKFEGLNHGRAIFKRYSKTSHPSMIRIGVYDQGNKNLKDLQRSEIIDMKLNFIFSEIAINDTYPWLLLPVFNFDISFKDLVTTNKLVADEFRKSQKETKIDDETMLYVEVMEHFFKMMTLKEYLDQNAKNLSTDGWKALFFYLLYPLYHITEKIPTFRHNKLDLDSIYLYTKKSSDKKQQFNIKDSIFEVPDIGIQAKITNFIDAYAKDIAQNPKVKSKEDLYYDVHYLFHNLLTYLGEQMPFDLKQFFQDIVPEQLRSEPEKFSGLDEAFYESSAIDPLTPYIVLTKNNFFSEFIKDSIMGQKSRRINKSENAKSYSAMDSSIDYSFSNSLTNESSDDLLFGIRQDASSDVMVGGGKRVGKRRLSKSVRVVPDEESDDSMYTIVSDGQLDDEEEAPKEEEEEEEEMFSETSDVPVTEKPKPKEKKDKEDEDEESEELVLESSDEEDEAKVHGGPDEEQQPATEAEELSDEPEEEEEVPPPMNGFMKLFGETMGPKFNQFGFNGTGGISQFANMGKKRSKKRSQAKEEGVPMPDGMMGKLPDGFSGRVPDWMQDKMPTPNGGVAPAMMGAMGMPQMGTPQMGPHMGMPAMGPQMGMPQMGMPAMGPQMGMPQMGMPQMGPQLSPPVSIDDMGQMPNFSDSGFGQIQTMSATSPMSRYGAMSPAQSVNSMSAQHPMAERGINVQGHDYASLLPQNMLMNPSQGQAQQMGGNRSNKKKTFFS